MRDAEGCAAAPRVTRPSTQARPCLWLARSDGRFQVAWRRRRSTAAATASEAKSAPELLVE